MKTEQELETKLKQLENRDKILNNLVENLRKEKNNVELTLKAAEQHIKNIENENMVFRKLINEKFAEVEKERNTYKIEWESAKELLVELGEDVATRNKTIFDQKEQIKRLHAHSEQREDAMIKLEKSLEKKDKQLAKQQQKIEELEQINGELKSEIDDLKRQRAELQTVHCQDIKEAKEEFVKLLEENTELEVKIEQRTWIIKNI